VSSLKGKRIEVINVAGFPLKVDHVSQLAAPETPASDQKDITKEAKPSILDYTGRSLEGLLRHKNIKQKEQTIGNFRMMVEQSKPITVEIPKVQVPYKRKGFK
jgi:hypothetical protein